MKRDKTEKGEVWDFVNIPRIGFDEKDYFNHHLKKYDLVKDVIENKKPMRILDVGISSGFFYSLLPDSYKGRVLGVDIVPEYMSILKKRGIEARLCNVEKELFPSKDEGFDMVICDSILEHTLKPKHLISEIQRVMKPGGNFIMVIPNATSIIRRWHMFRGRNIFEPLIDNLYTKDYLTRCSIFYSEKEVRFVLEDNNLKIDKISYINETSHDDRALAIKGCRFLGLLVPKFRDVIFMVGSKK